MPGDHLVEDDPQRVEVGTPVGGLALDLLGRDVGGRPLDGPFLGALDGAHQPGQPEIHDQGAAVLVDHDVVGLQVAMDDVAAMGLGQAPADLCGEPHGLRGVQPPHFLDEAPEILAPDVFHGDVGDAAGFVQVEQPGHVLMDDLAGGLELVPEPLQCLAVVGQVVLDELQGDFFVELSVEDAVDPPHAAGAQLFDDLVAPGEYSPRPELDGGDELGLGEVGIAGGGGGFAVDRGPAFAAKALRVRVVQRAVGTLHLGGPPAGILNR